MFVGLLIYSTETEFYRRLSYTDQRLPQRPQTEKKTTVALSNKYVNERNSIACHA